MGRFHQFQDFGLALDGFAIDLFGVSYWLAGDTPAAMAPALDPDGRRARLAFEGGLHPRRHVLDLAPEAGLGPRVAQNALALKLMAGAQERPAWIPVDGGSAMRRGAPGATRIRLRPRTVAGQQEEDEIAIEYAPPGGRAFRTVARAVRIDAAFEAGDRLARDAGAVD